MISCMYDIFFCVKEHSFRFESYEYKRAEIEYDGSRDGRRFLSTDDTFIDENLESLQDSQRLQEISEVKILNNIPNSS